MTDKASPAFDRLYVRPPADEPRRGSKAIWTTLWIVFGLFALMMVVGRETEPDRVERMKRECAQQSPTKVNECVISLMLRYGAEQQQSKLNSAYQRSR